MLVNYNRTIEKGGAYFYEPDFFINNVVFYNATKAIVKMEYNNQGFGILLSKNGFEKESKLEDAYGMFFTEDKIEFVRFLEGERTVLDTIAYRVTMPIKDFEVELYKNGDYLYLSHDGKIIMYEKIDTSYTSYGFGFYVNRWNIVKSINYKSNTPQEWDLNVISSTGGKVQFYKDGFSIIDAATDVQIEQSNIALKAGTYYLTYEQIKSAGEFDIKCYVYKSEDDRLRVEDKNILEGNKIILEDDTDVSIHFAGQIGAIEQIALKKSEHLPYVSNDGKGQHKDGSAIHIDLEKIVGFSVKGKVNAVPTYALDEEPQYYYAMHKGFEFHELHTGLGAGKDFEITLSDGDLTFVTDIEKVISLSGKGELQLLYNVDAIITEFKVTYENGKILDYLHQHTEKFYVPKDITSPILALDKFYEPLDMSSAYRRIENDARIYYRFTNTERELFEGSYRVMHLAKEIRTNDPQIIVYGIKPGVIVNENSLYDTREGIEDISLFAEDFDIIPPDWYAVDTAANTVTVKKEFEELYDSYVIDYLKERSYAVNFDEELSVYEVDISHSSETRVMYDYGEDGSIRQYVSTGIKPDGDKYIVLSV